MRCSRRQAAAAVSNGKIVVCGGMNKDRISVPLSSVECFDPESGVWSEWDEMPSPLRGHCIFSYGNALAVLGGHDGDSCVSSAIVWAETDKWYVSPMSMNHPCRLFTVAMLDGKLVAIGGWNKRGRQDLSRVEMMTVDGWTPGPDLPYECSQLSSLVIPRNMFDWFFYVLLFIEINISVLHSLVSSWSSILVSNYLWSMISKETIWWNQLFRE